MNSDKKLLFAVLSMAGLVVIVSFQNCSRPLVQAVAPKPSKASDLSDMLQSSEQEIEETKHNLSKNAGRNNEKLFQNTNPARREPANNVMTEDGYSGHRALEQRSPASVKDVVTDGEPSGSQNSKLQRKPASVNEESLNSSPVKLKLKRAPQPRK